MDLDALLGRFARLAQSRDAAGFAALFTEDGCYDDHFFGAHHGREAIAAMLDRFHHGGEAFLWEFSDPVRAGDLAYASYVFSYRSREPESAGRTICFEGIARLRLRDGFIAHYAEVFDRGVAFSQLGYPVERTAKLLARYARATHEMPQVAAHLARRRAGTTG